jgi:hypothetical protein
MIRILLVLFLMLCCGCISTGPSVRLQKLTEGTCVDRALVIYQQLKADGKESRVVLGLVRENDEIIGGHAWVEYKQNNQWIRIKNY